jgi:hypothetical protein
VVYCDRGTENAGFGLQQLTTGIVLPMSKSFNFTVPCSSVPPSLWSSSSPPLTYGPSVYGKTFQGGYLDRFNPPISFWESSVPGGLNGVKRAEEKKWSNPTEWRVHAYHPQSWGNWGFQVESYASGDLSFTSNSGNQEARGGGNAMGERYVPDECDKTLSCYYLLAHSRILSNCHR